MDTTTENIFADADLIASYSRAQALEDGELVALDPELCKQAGFRYPVAVTRAVFESVINLTPAAKRACNDLVGRTWDVLHMAHMAARRAQGDKLTFTVLAVVTRVRPTPVRLVMTIGPGDTPEPVMTIMLPGEN
jgi:hypothetical protein